MQNDSYISTPPEATASSALAKLLSPIRQSRAFTYLWLGQWIAMLGSSVTMIILPIVIYNLTGSSTMMGLAMTIYMLPNVLILPVSGWIVDRTDRLRLIWLTNATRFLIMLTAAVLVFIDQLSLPVLYVGLALYGLMDGIFVPAYSALRAEIFTPDIRNAANALSQMSIQAVRLLGPAIGGLIVTFTSPGSGFALDSLTYLISLACFIGLGRFYVSSRKHTKQQTLTQDKMTKSSMMSDLLEGFRILKSHPWLWITIVIFSLLNICFQGIIAILVPWLFKIHYGFSPVVYGLAMAGTGVGAVLAALLFGSRSHWRHRGWLGYGGAILSGVALLLLSIVSWAPGLVLVMVLEGFGMMMFALIWETSLQELVPIESFGRVSSLDLLGSYALLPLGYLLVGWLADYRGGIWTIALFSIIGMLLLVAGLCTKGIRNFD
ncbi:MFS transporter [Paenibacillus hunanensis]|uniref:MFS transporter n=1 Tax=Paenibacillus hunanensis TaxID=539262 RepID=UPI002A69A810|nr:MFS transporter [Paenibacillus hunanensis]WPP42647.1 MFS transporter [Paenibacillus hunanensis]